MIAPTTKLAFIESLKIRMGFPNIPIEISDDQFDLVIQEALQYYSKYIYDGMTTKVVVLETEADVNDYILSPPDYPDGIFSITEVLPLTSSWLANAQYGMSESMISWTYSLFDMKNGGLADMVDMDLGFQNINMFKKLFASRTDWSWNYNKSLLTLSADSYNSGKFGLLCDILSTDTQEGPIWQNEWFINYCLQLSIRAMGAALGGVLLGPSATINLPGGGEVSPGGIMETANEKIKELEEYAQENLSQNYFGVYMG